MRHAGALLVRISNSGFRHGALQGAGASWQVRKTPRRFVRCALVAHTIAYIGLLSGCLVDPDSPCSANQVERDELVTGCQCAAGFVPSEDLRKCVACGPNERVVADLCQCIAGFARTRIGGPCEPIGDAGGPIIPMGPTGQGEMCESDADCEGYDANFCQQLAEPYLCLVKDCADGTNPCTPPYECCDLSAIGPRGELNGLCIPEGACVTPGEVVPQ